MQIINHHYNVNVVVQCAEIKTIGIVNRGGLGHRGDLGQNFKQLKYNVH